VVVFSESFQVFARAAGQVANPLAQVLSARGVGRARDIPGHRPVPARRDSIFCAPARDHRGNRLAARAAAFQHRFVPWAAALTGTSADVIESGDKMLGRSQKKPAKATIRINRFLPADRPTLRSQPAPAHPLLETKDSPWLLKLAPYTTPSCPATVVRISAAIEAGRRSNNNRQQQAQKPNQRAGPRDR
jgi:hypothetical protein